jgi:3-oxoacyl-(acyl-carrier-protein) synthase
VNIFLTDYRTAWTPNVRMVGDIKYPQSVHVFDDTYKRVSTGLVYVPHKVAEKVLDPVLCESLRQEDCKTAFILAGGNGHFAGIVARHYDNSLSYIYKFLPFSLTQVYAGRIAQSLGAVDQITTDATACASSLKVMMDVQNLIWTYKFDRVIVLSVEDGVSNSVLDFFGEAQASLSYHEENFGIQPSAFDSVNYGFRVAQGAVLAIFESDAYLQKSGHTPKAQLLGAYTASENCTNAIGQREDGQGFVNAISGALEVANLTAEKISVVKTHGTGTKSNNAAERRALEKVVPSFVATSYKPTIGHTMGVSGLLETCLLLDSMKQGVVPKIENRTEQDGVFLSEDKQLDGSAVVLSLAAGMGNVYSAALFDTRISS